MMMDPGGEAENEAGTGRRQADRQDSTDDRDNAQPGTDYFGSILETSTRNTVYYYS